MHIDLDSIAREHAAPLISVLTRLFGPHKLQLAEDVVQESFVRALSKWREEGVPDDPAAWLYRVARNRAIDTIRRERKRSDFAEDLESYLDSEFTLVPTVEREFDEDRIRDDTLRMIFMCCNSKLAPESSIPLVLKTLCGLSVPAIARALLQREETVRKRLTRAREALRGVAFEFPARGEMHNARTTARKVLYLLFNEGNLSSSDETPLRPELCRDAMRLTKLLVDQPTIADGATTAMLALMCFHVARFPARIDADGKLLGLDVQERSRWNAELIGRGFALLERSSHMGDRRATRFHLEAAIAARHCSAQRFEETDWVSICRLYERWLELEASPVVALSHAIALSYRDGPTAARARVEALGRDAQIARSAAYPATLAILLRRMGQDADAAAMTEEARKRATAHEHDLLSRQLARVKPELA